MSTNRAPGTARAGLEDTLRDWWATKPARPMRNRKLAGVAAALGQRYGIDPLLPRVVFATLTLVGGSGLVCYLLGWLLLPREGDEHSALGGLAGRGHSSVSPVITVLLCLMLVITTASMFGRSMAGGASASGPIGFVAQLVALYLLHTRRRGQAVPTRPAAAPPVVAPATTVPSPASWAPPVGTDPGAPVSKPAPVRPRRRRARVGWVGVLVVVVTGLACLLLAPFTGGWLTVPRALAVVLAALGITMVVGAFRGGGRGLAWLAAPLAIAALVAGQLGDGPVAVHARPAALDQLRPSYTTRAGSIELDLTRLPTHGTAHTKVSSRLGPVRVLVPAGAEVTARCHTGFGPLDCLGTHAASGGASSVTAHLPGTGTRPLRVTLTASTEFGPVRVSRG